MIERHEYREHRPRAELAEHVDAFWTRDLESSGDGSVRVLPDGCADILFDLTALGGEFAFVVGPMTRPFLVPPEPRSRMVAVRFRPGAARAFLGIPLNELLDARVSLSDLLDDAHAIEDTVAGASDVASAVRALERALLARRTRANPRAARVIGAIERLTHANATSVERMANELGFTRQHFTREFREHVGLGPKMLARVLRMQRAARALHASSSTRLTDVALDSGYYDQAHLTSEFRALTGVTPRTWREAGSKSPRRAASAALD